MKYIKFIVVHAWIVFIAIGFVVYGSSLSNTFAWDDEEQIVNNTIIRSITNLPQIFTGSTFNTGGTGTLQGSFYKPLMIVCFSVLHWAFDANPFFFHLFQLILHSINAYLIFLLFTTIFPESRKDTYTVPFFLSLVFLLHPINVEAIVYSSSLQDVMYMFFGLLSLLVLITKKLSMINMLFLSVLFLLSLLSKETGVLFIPVTILYSVFFQKYTLKPLLTSIGAALSVYALLRFIVGHVFFSTNTVAPIARISLGERLYSIPKIIYYYITTFFFPKFLSISQHWVVRSPTITDFYVPLFSVLLFTLLIFWYYLYLRKLNKAKSQLYFFFACWFIVGICFHSQLYPLDMTVADRWFYVAEVGLLGMMAVVVLHIKQKILNYSRYVVVLALCVLIILSIRTVYRSYDWKNGLALYTKDAQRTLSFDLENNLGVELFRIGNIQEAKKHFEQSTILAPYWWINWNNLGAIYERENNIPMAKKYYYTAIDNGSYYLSYENIAKVLYFSEKNPKEAKEFISESIKLYHQNSTLWEVLALSNYALNANEEALVAAKNAYALAPSEQTAYVVIQIQSGKPIKFDTK